MDSDKIVTKYILQDTLNHLNDQSTFYRVMRYDISLKRQDYSKKTAKLLQETEESIAMRMEAHDVLEVNIMQINLNIHQLSYEK